jgi:transcription initiation factor TFIID subunit 5
MRAPRACALASGAAPHHVSRPPAAQPELCRLLYPVFVHTYLQLVALGAASEAHTLLADHRQRLLDAAGVRGARVRERELHELLSLSAAEQLDGSALARGVRAARTPARLTQYAHDLLLRFLHSANLLLMLGLVNERLAVEVVDALPGGAAGAEEEGSGGLAGGAAAAADADTVNQAALELQLLQGGVEQRYAEAAAARAEAEAAARAEDDAGKLTKKQRAAVQREVAAAKTRREAVSASCRAPAIPLPEVPEERQAALLAEMAAREGAGAGGKPVSPDALPSAAFFTFVNTQQTLNCAALSADGARVAGGFADSSLRVYDLRADAAARAAAAGAAGPSAAAAAQEGPLCLYGHSGPVFAVDFSPDEQLLLSAGADGSVRLWSMELRVALAAYKGHMLPVWDAAFAPHFGFYFASGGADRAARVWSTERAQAVRVFVGHQSDVDVVRWHPNCHYLATGSSDQTVRLWDLRTGGCVRMLSGHGAAVSSPGLQPAVQRQRAQRRRGRCVAHLCHHELTFFCAVPVALCRSPPWPSPPTGPPWPAATPTARSAPGTWGRRGGWRRVRRTLGPCGRWPTARVKAGCWSQGAQTAPPSCGPPRSRGPTGAPAARRRGTATSPPGAPRPPPWWRCASRRAICCWARARCRCTSREKRACKSIIHRVTYVFRVGAAARANAHTCVDRNRRLPNHRL